LLRLQSRRVEDPVAAAALAEAVRRVASIAIVHETLSATSAEVVLFDEVYDRIVHNAIELSSRPISLSKVGEFGNFDSKVATPLALVITELIHNSLEHGLESAGDSLSVEVMRSDVECHVIVSDNGVGPLPKSKAPAGLGTKLYARASQSRYLLRRDYENERTILEIFFPINRSTTSLA